MIRESPLHTLKLMRTGLFANMAAIKESGVDVGGGANGGGGKRNILFAMDAIKDLFLSSLLPDDRRLR